jgi:hypothetical protein
LLDCSFQIVEDYRVNWIVDNLPAATRVVEPAANGSPARIITIYERGFPLGFKGGNPNPNPNPNPNLRGRLPAPLQRRWPHARQTLSPHAANPFPYAPHRCHAVAPRTAALPRRRTTRRAAATPPHRATPRRKSPVECTAPNARRTTPTRRTRPSRLTTAGGRGGAGARQAHLTRSLPSACGNLRAGDRRDRRGGSVPLQPPPAGLQVSHRRAPTTCTCDMCHVTCDMSTTGWSSSITSTCAHHMHM